MACAEKPECAEETTQSLFFEHTGPAKPRLCTHTQAKHLRLHSFIPVLNRDTANPDTYDIDYLLDPRFQRIPLGGHRLKQSGHEVGCKYAGNKRRALAQKQIHAKSQPKLSLSNEAHCRRVNKAAARLLQHKQAVSDKLEAQRQARAAEELKECTFQPCVNASGGPKRSCEQYYQDMLRRKAKCEAKVAQSQEAQRAAQETFSHHPTLCEKSLKLAHSKSYLSLGTRSGLLSVTRPLFTHEFAFSKFNSDQPYEGSPTPEFTPNVNSRSKQLKRNLPIEELLYQDAVRRLQKGSPPRPPTQPLTSKNSTNLLTTKLLSDFKEAAVTHDVYKTGEVNYTRFTALLAQLRLIGGVNEMNVRETELTLQLWQLLQKNKQVDLEHLKVAVMGVMGYFESWMTKVSGFPLSLAKTRLLHDQFNLFFKSRVTSKRLAPQKPKNLKLSPAKKTHKPVSPSSAQSPASAKSPQSPKSPKSPRSLQPAHFSQLADLTIRRQLAAQRAGAAPDNSPNSPHNRRTKTLHNLRVSGERRRTCVSLHDIRNLRNNRIIVTNERSSEASGLFEISTDQPFRISTVLNPFYKTIDQESVLSPIAQEEESSIVKQLAPSDVFMRNDSAHNSVTHYNLSFLAFEEDSQDLKSECENITGFKAGL